MANFAAISDRRDDFAPESALDQGQLEMTKAARGAGTGRGRSANALNGSLPEERCDVARRRNRRIRSIV